MSKQSLWYARGVKMKMGQDISTKMNALLKEMGLEEEFKKITSLFSDLFTIKGEETEELKEALHRAPDDLINLIWEKIEDEASYEEISRQQKEESIYEDIPEYFKLRFELMDIARLQLLIQIASYEPVGGMDTATVMNEFVPMGWAFAFSDDNGSVSFAVMKEIKDIIKTVEEPDVKEHMVFMSGIRYMVRTCMGLYGVCTLREVRNIFLMNASEDKNAGKEEAGDVDKILQEFLPFLEEDKELWLDGKYIVSPYFKTEKEYQELLRRQKKNYYIPDADEILSYGAGSMTIKNDEYKAVFRILNREVKDRAQTEEMLAEVSEYVIREDWEIPEIMNCLYDWDVAFSSDRAADKLVRALSI
ncbi:hypothetical protein D5281_08940 [bacterium 1xD42-62]|uniref:Uncharacterized protein n=2 Tax=Parablautia muri TaxID=2320879 RepID=A0A9X5BFJ3_9FIRM|nr:hypothetical protein [Parablautia muri]